jgi:hypothetical protein
MVPDGRDTLARDSPHRQHYFLFFSSTYKHGIAFEIVAV